MDGENDLAMDYAAFRHYMSIVRGAGSNTQTLNRMKAALPVIIRDRLTDRQKTYLIAYFFDGLNVREIGELYGVNKSTVSRSIHRGMRRVYRRLISIEPDLAGTPMVRAYISNR